MALEPEQLICPQSPSIPAEAQGEGDQAVDVAPHSATLQVVSRGCGWRHHLRGI